MVLKFGTPIASMAIQIATAATPTATAIALETHGSSNKSQSSNMSNIATATTTATRATKCNKAEESFCQHGACLAAFSQGTLNAAA